VLCVLACLFTALPLRAADDGARKPDVGVVHAAGDEAWIDVPADLGDTWKATLAELKERGHLADADVSYVESNGQIALSSLWIAVLPGASLDVPITRVRIVVLVSAEDHEQHTAALVGAGALLGAIAERLPAASATPSPVGAAAPDSTAPAYAETVDPGAVSDELFATYNTYNTYNTYSTYDPLYPAYVGYAPSVVYVWKPWWWSGWCHDNWGFGWNTWGFSYWNSGWGFGWGWNAGCNSWWNWPCNWSSWNCNDSWSDCDDDDDNGGGNGGGSGSFVAAPAPVDTGLQTRLVEAPSLSFSRRSTPAGTSESPRAPDPVGSTPAGVASSTNRVTPLSETSPRWRISRNSPAPLASVDVFPPRTAPAELSDRGASGSPSRSARSSRSIVVTDRSSSGTRAKPGSVTKMKGLSLTTKLGGIQDAGSLARGTAAPKPSSGSPGFSASSSGKASSPFTIGGNSGGRSSPGVSTSSSSSSSSAGHSSNPSPTRSSASHSTPFTIGSSSQSRQAAPAPQAAPRSVPAPAARSAGSSRAPSVGHSSGGSSGSSAGRSSGGGSASSSGGGSSGSRGASSAGSSSGGSSHGGGGRSSGRGPR
jgi:hypothetical protein